MEIPGSGTLKMIFESSDGTKQEHVVHEFDGPGVGLCMFNMDESIRGFAKSSFSYARMRGIPVILGTKNTILKKYDGRFMSIFEEVSKEFPDVEYEHRLIDDLVAYMIKSDGGYLAALKNYDGDVISGMLSTAHFLESCHFAILLVSYIASSFSLFNRYQRARLRKSRSYDLHASLSSRQWQDH